MTLTLHDLNELRRAERDTGALLRPPTGFLTDLEIYMTLVRADLGDDPLEMDGSEAVAAATTLEEYFQIRRDKLTVSARDLQGLEAGVLLPFERDVYAMMMKTQEELIAFAHRAINPKPLS